MTQFTIPEGSGDVILAYVRNNAARWPVERMTDRVRDGLAQLEAAVESLPSERFDWQAPHEEPGWTAAHIVDHVTGINLGTADRCAAVAASGQLPSGEPAPLPQTRSERLSEHRNRIEAALTRLEDADDGHADITWEHPLLGPLNWKEWLLTIRVHCLAHATQLNAIRAADEPKA
jgi:hypothetical protein